MTAASNLAAVASIIQAPTGTAPAYQCRAWVNFNGTGTVAIRASGNVSSITDVSTGQYAVNFTTSMPDANYATIVTTADNPGVDYGSGGAVPTTYANAVYVMCPLQSAVGKYDPTIFCVAVFR